MQEILGFLGELARNNDREWFAANKQRYKDVQSRVNDIAKALIRGIAEFEPAAETMTPPDCLYRIYRDTRFKADKTPYKTHIGIYINPYGGKKSQFGGYYLHLEPGQCLVGGGLWCPTSPVLKAVRKAIYDNVEEYLEIIQDPEFAKIYTEIGEDRLKTAPQGYPKDWEHIDLIRPRSFTACGYLSDRQVCSPKMIASVLDAFRKLKPFNDFLNYTFEENPDLPRFFPTR